MDKQFLNELADKMENMQFLGSELDKDSQDERENTKADYEEACSDLERTLFEWVEGQITDPEPDEPEKTPAYYNTVAQKGSELGLLLIDAGNYLLDCSKNWRR